MPAARPRPKRQSPRLTQAAAARSRIVGSAPSPHPEDHSDDTTWVWMCECELPKQPAPSITAMQRGSAIEVGAKHLSAGIEGGLCVCGRSMRLNGVGHVCARPGHAVQPTPLCPDCRTRRMRRARVVDQTGFDHPRVRDRYESVWSELTEPDEDEVEVEIDGVRERAVVVKREESPGVVPPVEDQVSYEAEAEDLVSVREVSVTDSLDLAMRHGRTPFDPECPREPTPAPPPNNYTFPRTPSPRPQLGSPGHTPAPPDFGSGFGTSQESPLARYGQSTPEEADDLLATPPPPSSRGSSPAGSDVSSDSEVVRVPGLESAAAAPPNTSDAARLVLQAAWHVHLAALLAAASATVDRHPNCAWALAFVLSLVLASTTRLVDPLPLLLRVAEGLWAAAQLATVGLVSFVLVGALGSVLQRQTARSS